MIKHLKNSENLSLNKRLRVGMELSYTHSINVCTGLKEELINEKGRPMPQRMRKPGILAGIV